MIYFAKNLRELLHSIAVYPAHPLVMENEQDLM